MIEDPQVVFEAKRKTKSVTTSVNWAGFSPEASTIFLASGLVTDQGRWDVNSEENSFQVVGWRLIERRQFSSCFCFPVDATLGMGVGWGGVGWGGVGWGGVGHVNVRWPGGLCSEPSE